MSKGHTLCRISTKTGKCDMAVDTRMGKAQLVLWALQNTPVSKKCVIYETDTLQITDIVTGNSSGFPDIERDIYNYELYVEYE